MDRSSKRFLRGYKSQLKKYNKIYKLLELVAGFTGFEYENIKKRLIKGEEKVKKYIKEIEAGKWDKWDKKKKVKK